MLSLKFCRKARNSSLCHIVSSFSSSKPWPNQVSSSSEWRLPVIVWPLHAWKSNCSSGASTCSSTCGPHRPTCRQLKASGCFRQLRIWEMQPYIRSSERLMMLSYISTHSTRQWTKASGLSPAPLWIVVREREPKVAVLGRCKEIEIC